MNTIETIIARIEELRNSGYADAKVKAYLTLDDYSATDIATAFKQIGGAKKPKGFASEYYDWLGAESRTEAEATAYIKGDGEYGDTTNNVKKHLSHYLNIQALTVAIWDAKVTAEDDMDPEVKAAWAIHDGIKAKYESGKNLTKADKRKVHPDKIASLKDDALTKAYTELYQIVNG